MSITHITTTTKTKTLIDWQFFLLSIVTALLVPDSQYSTAAGWFGVISYIILSLGPTATIHIYCLVGTVLSTGRGTPVPVVSLLVAYYCTRHQAVTRYVATGSQWAVNNDLLKNRNGIWNPFLIYFSKI